MYVYCLFCQTQKAKYVVYALEARGFLRVFTPKIIRRQRVRGKNVDGLYDLLPGYVFVFSEEKLEDLRLLGGVTGVIRRLGSPEDQYALTGADRDFALNLDRKGGVVGQVTLFKVGDAVRLDDPLFNGCAGRITRIDHKKGRARVDYQFAGMSCHTWVACETVTLAEAQAEAPIFGAAETKA